MGTPSFIAAILAEVSYPSLLIDVRYNSGGHVSQLILEKLSRRRIGYDSSALGDTVIRIPPCFGARPDGSYCERVCRF